MTTVFLDSNIYRQFGHDFSKSVEYSRLSDYLSKTANEFGLLSVIRKELEDYISIEIFDRLKSEYNRLKSQFEKNPFIDIQNITSFDQKIEEGKATALSQLDIHIPKVDPEYYESESLIKFLLFNKRANGKRDNTRDFLIFIDLVNYCQENLDEQVVFITNDEIFTVNEHFLNIKKEKSISNLHFFKSIPDFLKEFGPQFDFIDDTLILSLVPDEVVRAELLKDIKCFPSYVSKYYYDKKENEVPDIESLEIGNYSVYDSYVTKNLATEQFEIQFSLKVPIKAIYKPEENVDALKVHLANAHSQKMSINPETIDENFRPIFEHSVLFLFEGTVNTENKSIENVFFIDFFPDHFLFEELKQKIEVKKQVASQEYLCIDGQPHDFDMQHGFYRPSMYGGGLSWHYRCSKCGRLYDTGEYFD